jgi:hypothetical protein
MKITYCVFINGDWHSDVEASSEADALEIVLDRGVGYCIHEMSAEPHTGSDESEEDYYPRSLYGN